MGYVEDRKPVNVLLDCVPLDRSTKEVKSGEKEEQAASERRDEGKWRKVQACLA